MHQNIWNINYRSMTWDFSIMALQTEPRHWVRDNFLISTNKNFLSIPAINHAFGQDFLYWANPMPEHVLQSIIDNCLSFGLYKSSHSFVSENENGSQSSALDEFSKGDLQQIGFSRLITDNVTFAYLTDVYVLPEYQGSGLGGWLIDCVDEVLNELPYLRWAMLRTAEKKSVESYKKRLGMSIIQSSDVSNGPVMMGKRGNAALVWFSYPIEGLHRSRTQVFVQDQEAVCRYFPWVHQYWWRWKSCREGLGLVDMIFRPMDNDLGAEMALLCHIQEMWFCAIVCPIDRLALPSIIDLMNQE